MRKQRLVSLCVLFAIGAALTACSSSDEADPAVAAPGTDAVTTTTEAAPASIEKIAISANGFVFDARRAGPVDGDLVVLLHGFPQTSYEWRAQLLELGNAGYHAVAPDQRGYSPGARPEGDSEYTIDYMVTDTIAIADSFNVEKFHVVGHDWGATVAWATAIAHPERIATLTALSVPHPDAYAVASANPDGEQRAKQGYLATFSAPDAAVGLGANITGFLRAAAPAGATDADIAETANVLGAPGALAAALAWYRANDLRGGGGTGAGVVTVPTLFVFGTADCCLGRDAADLTADYVTGPYQYEVLEGASHWLPEENADEISALLLKHLGRIEQ